MEIDAEQSEPCQPRCDRTVIIGMQRPGNGLQAVGLGPVDRFCRMDQ